MTSASSIPLSSTLRVLSQNINRFQTKVTMRKRKQTRIVALGSLLPFPSQAHVTTVAMERHRQGVAWTEPDFMC